MNRGVVRFVVSFAAILCIGLLLTPSLRGQYEEEELRPRTCPITTTFAGYLSGIWFVGVHQIRDTSYADNVARYLNTNYRVVSTNKKWLWEGGGGTFTCHEQWVVGAWISYNVLVSGSLEGNLLPINEPEEEPPPPPPGGGGSSEHDHFSTDIEICRYEYSYSTETGVIYWIRLLYCYS